MGVTPDEVWGNPDQYEGKPFYELVHFADNEGSIGPVTSAKLAHDFQSHRHQIKNWDAHSTNAYDLMQKCFEVASDNGFVIFH
jgi:hypothetical protein